MISLAGWRILVTGGSRGIGRATALLAAQAGADVALTYRVRRDEAETVARAIRGMGRRAIIAGGDLADADRVSQIFAEVGAAFGGLDGFVANHGIWPATDTALAAMAPERWAATLRTNLDGVFLTTRAALGLMSSQGGARGGAGGGSVTERARPGSGSVVLVTSTAAQRGEAYHADYAASKGAIVSLVKSLAIECAPGIRVNGIAPGWVDTVMSASAFEGEGRQRIAAGIPIQRIASALDIAGPIVFLLSDLARHITGEILNVNGGSVLCG